MPGKGENYVKEGGSEVNYGLWGLGGCPWIITRVTSHKSDPTGQVVGENPHREVGKGRLNTALNLRGRKTRCKDVRVDQT